MFQNWFESISRTILKDPFDIESVRCARFIISTTFQITSQLPGPRVINQPWVALTNCILRAYKDDRYVGNVGVVLGHLGVVRVDGIEAHLILQTEDKDDCVDPVCELNHCNTDI